jgi:hypothetical protein
MHTPSLHDGTCSPPLHGTIFLPRSFGGRAIGLCASSSQQSSFVLQAMGVGAGSGGGATEATALATGGGDPDGADASAGGADEGGAGALADATGALSIGACGAAASRGASLLHAAKSSASTASTPDDEMAGEILTPSVVP